MNPDGSFTSKFLDDLRLLSTEAETDHTGISAAASLLLALIWWEGGAVEDWPDRLPELLKAHFLTSTHINTLVAKMDYDSRS
jgi:hypothetical protein